ncbi:hypothetical protein Taro_053589, partial [Colocasia esculenta]|nr:hypothetical protein [Colocasia esculenta]
FGCDSFGKVSYPVHGRMFFSVTLVSVEMNEPQNRKVQELQKPIPGCMGRMINIFDLSVGMAGTKMLTDRAHPDGYMLKASDPIPIQMEDKSVTYELKRSSPNKRSGGTPMKMLIAQEMSKETETKRKPPSVVAKLMGFDGLPVQQSVPTPQGIILDPYKHSAHQHDGHLSQLSGRTLCYGQEENRYFDMITRHDIRPSQLHFSDRREYKDVYEVWPQQSRMNHFRDQPLPKGRHNENLNDKRMALVRQKFMEAKRLATDQQLLQSKEFQEALEVLSSNRDLFLKFLEEPNSLFSKHLQELYTVTTAPQTKRITVLKPSRSDSGYGDDMKKHYSTVKDDQFDKNKLSRSPAFIHPKAENLSQPTRIVVLKPSPRKPQDLRAAIDSSTFCTGLLDDRDIFEELGSDGGSESREVAKEITRQMRESLSGNRRDDTLLSSVLSNGYIGDESSFNRSDNEFMEDDGGNFSDSDIATPTSRHSWDNIHRFGSPCSLSSLSRASYSPESSVIREAKKRLSERWAMVASNGTVQQQRQVRRSSSTLGEMLAIPETKKEDDNEGESSRPCGGQQDAGSPAPCSSVKGSEDGSGGAGSPRHLLRSKSLPATSLAYEGIRRNVEPSTSEVEKSIASKDPIKPKSGKSSLKGKVSSLFFSKNKKPNREKSEPSPLVDTLEGVQAANLKSMDKTCGNISQCFSTNMQGDSQRSEELICESSSLETSENGVKHGSSSVKAASSLAKVRASVNASDNQEQPSPISVLEASFEDDGNSSSLRSSSESANLECRQLISRSPPIGSVARSLSWEDAHSDTSTRKLSRIFSKADEEEECYSFVKSLLSSSGLANGKSSTALSGWHSLESPLDPLLLDKFLERKEEDAKCRKRRSNQHLLFDSVNAALLDINRTVILDASQVKVFRSRVPCSGSPAGASITEEVWGRVKTWLHSQDQSAASEGENSGLVVDEALRNEVTGSGWAEMISLEVNEIVKEVEGKLLEELVGEALANLLPGSLTK